VDENRLIVKTTRTPETGLRSLFLAGKLENDSANSFEAVDNKLGLSKSTK
jgi:hypothetical protein